MLAGAVAAHGVAPSAAPPALAAWAPVPRLAGRLDASQLGLVINTEDPYSLEVGRYYARRRGLKPQQVLELSLPVRPALTPAELESLRQRIGERFGPQVQALALAWKEPYAVGCNSITGALTLGFDAALCRSSCDRARLSRYFNSPSARPFSELGLRPSMLIAASDAAHAKAMIDRGVASHGRLGLRGGLPVNAYFVSTSDAPRNVRAALFPPAGLLRRQAVDVKIVRADDPGPLQRVLIYQTGLARVAHLSSVQWVDGALADHLTSFGGRLGHENSQMSVLAWTDAGATASYGTVSEPCNHVQKFPHPQLLLQHYLQGSTALEAYWKSVAWPQQGVFVGEPLAAPFAR